MTEIMSLSNAPDEAVLGRVAGALAVDEAFVEKDWYVVQAIGGLLACATDDLTPVFSGGTALLKAHRLIQRFSEDIDFKLTLSDSFLAKTLSGRRSTLSQFKKSVATTWEAAGFTDILVEAGSGNAYFQIEMNYPTVLKGHDSLRPHILAEISARAPRFEPVEKSIWSFVAQSQRRAPEIASILTVDPVETAADKLSAFTWRMLTRERGGDKDDPTIIRHVHDLAALEAIAIKHEGFADLLLETLNADATRGGGVLADRSPKERLDAMLAALEDDAGYTEEYDRFVSNMAFAGTGALPSFAEARAALRRLCQTIG